jgi:GxxExxY protein
VNHNQTPKSPIPETINQVSKEVVEAAFRVHSALGPGLLEGVYERCLLYELSTMGLKVKRQVRVPIRYGAIILRAGLRLDLVVERSVIVEVKAIEAMRPVHEAQLLTYLRLSGLRLGLLINFNVRLIRDGIKRLVV